MVKNMKTKILFTHNTAMWYRLPFFRKLSEIYDLDLVFTHINVIHDVYDKNVENRIEGLEGVNYTVLKNSGGFARGLVSKVLHRYDLTVGGSWDTPQELLESILLFVITKIKREPLVIWREDWDWKRENSIKERILTLIIKFLCNHSDAILVPGSLHREYFNKRLDVPLDKIHIMPNVSNIEGNADLSKKEHSSRKILYVGRLIERKGVKYLLDAYNNLDVADCELIIVGSGPEEENLKEYVNENMIKNVTFTGKVNNEKLEEYYNSSNLVVIPSINKGMGDPWVFVLNEAMYYYNPVIATNAVGAAPDMIKDNGYIVDEKNSVALTDAMNKILNDESLQKKMSLKSKEIIDNEFQYVNMINSFNDLIKKIRDNN